MRRQSLAYIVVGLVLLSMAPAANSATDPQALNAFNGMFGTAYKGVIGTRSTADDAKLAAVLLSHGRETGSADPFTVLLFERTYELGSTHTSGFKPAVDALQSLVTIAPRRQLEMQEKLLRLYEIVFRTSRGTSDADKRRHTAAGNATVDLMIEIADAQSRKTDYATAARTLTKAYQIGRVVKSTKLDLIKQKLNTVKPMAVIGRKITSANRKLESDPKDKEAATELAEIFIQELDRPVTAKRYAARVYDKKQMDLLHWAGQPVHSLNADQSKALAKWYDDLADKASAVGAVPMLVRARVYYEQYLSLKPADAAAKLALTKTALTFAKHRVSDSEADRLAKSRVDRLGIQVVAVTPKPRPKPPTPPKVEPKTEPETTPKDPPKTTQPDDPPAIDMSFYEDEVEGEFAERKLGDEYWKKKSSIFEFK